MQCKKAIGLTRRMKDISIVKKTKSHDLVENKKDLVRNGFLKIFGSVK